MMAFMTYRNVASASARYLQHHLVGLDISRMARTDHEDHEADEAGPPAGRGICQPITEGPPHRDRAITVNTPSRLETLTKEFAVELGREPINMSRGRLVSVRYARIATEFRGAAK
jgi:hypothetical protein